MTTTAVRTHTLKFLREWSALRPLQAYFPRCSLSTNASTAEKTPAESVKYIIDPVEHPDFFKVNTLFSLQSLFEANVHLGHKEGSLHPNMRPFIFGSRLGHLIIDLDQTVLHLRQALNFAAHIAFHNGIILFISRHPHFLHIIDRTAKETGEYSHTREWALRTLTDSRFYGTSTRLPDLIIFINTMKNSVEEHPAVTHAAKMCIPTIGIVDTNCNPNLITYPVPGNDDTKSSIELYCSLFKQAILRGKVLREKITSEE